MKLTPTLGGAYSGSFGGLTASRNKGGQYLRRRSAPVNPNTSRQQLVRTIVGGLTQQWTSLLNETQRESWRVYAANTPFIDGLGQTVNISGVNAFVRANSTRALANNQGLVLLSTILTAPTIFNTGVAVGTVDTFDGDFTTPPGTITVSGDLNGTTDTTGDAFLFVAPPQNEGRKFFKGPYQLAATVPIDATDDTFAFTTVDLADPTKWASATIPVTGWDGLYVPLRLVIAYDDGRYSETWRMMMQFTDATP